LIHARMSFTFLLKVQMLYRNPRTMLKWSFRQGSMLIFLSVSLVCEMTCYLVRSLPVDRTSEFSVFRLREARCSPSTLRRMHKQNSIIILCTAFLFTFFFVLLLLISLLYIYNIIMSIFKKKTCTCCEARAIKTQRAVQC